jgi:hypothetical protein
MTISQSLQLIKHVGHISRHADLIGLGVVGFSPLHGALDVKGEKGAARWSGRIQQVPDGPHGADDRSTPPSTSRVPSAPPATLIGATPPCRPLNINYGKLRTHSYRRLWTTRPLAVECARGWGGKINVFTIARKGSIALFHHRREGNPCQPSCQKMTDFAQS